MKTRHTFACGVLTTFLLFQFTFLIRTLNFTHPVMMICVVTVFTAFACNSLRTSAACVLGIVVYIAVTFACKAWQPTIVNLFVTNVMYSVGVGIWSYGVCRAIQKTWKQKTEDRHLS